MLNGYYLGGVEGEDNYCFVLRTDDSEVIFRLIMRLCKTRDKDLRELGEQLLKDFNDRHRQDSNKTRPKDKSKISKRK